MPSYLLLKWLHIVGAVMMLGNVVVTGMWSTLLYRDTTVGRRSIARGILMTDLFFTVGGASLLVITGIFVARSAGLPLMGTGWIRHGIYLFAAAGLLWLLFLLPAEFRMERAADDEARFRALFRRWTFIGWAATLLLVGALWMMVMKP